MVHRLERFEVVKNVDAVIEIAEPASSSIASTIGNASAVPLSLKATVALHQKSRCPVSLSTLVQDDRAGLAARGALINVFGGAEFISGAITLDSKSRGLNSLDLTFVSPVTGSPDLRAHISAHKSTHFNAWASHNSALSGVTAKLVSKSAREPGTFAEFGVMQYRRSVTSVLQTASPTFRALEASNSNQKTSVFTRFVVDRRDAGPYPTSGYLVGVSTELAGVIGNNSSSNGLLSSDVSFLKTTTAASVSSALNPAQPDDLVLNFDFQSGLLWPYTQPRTTHTANRSSVFDRFHLGGSNYLGSGCSMFMPGFACNGVGPKDGLDSLGGDAYTFGSVSLLSKLPYFGSSALRFLLFFSGASLVPVSIQRPNPSDPSAPPTPDFKATCTSMVSDPSTCAGVGLVYRTPQAGVEMVYGVPLRARESDWQSKGLRVSVGLELDG